MISWLDGFTQRQLLRVAASARRLRNRWLRTADGGAGPGGDPGIGQAIDVMQGDRGLLCGRERAHRRVERPGGGARCAVSAGQARVPAVLLASIQADRVAAAAGLIQGRPVTMGCSAPLVLFDRRHPGRTRGGRPGDRISRSFDPECGEGGPPGRGRRVRQGRLAPAGCGTSRTATRGRPGPGVAFSTDPQAPRVCRLCRTLAWAAGRASGAGIQALRRASSSTSAMRFVFASALSTWTFTIWPTLTTSLGSLM